MHVTEMTTTAPSLYYLSFCQALVSICLVKSTPVLSLLLRDD